MGKFSCITNWLTIEASMDDKNAFEKWRTKQITTDECKELVMKHNEFPQLATQVITNELFEEWLSTIGWKRAKI